MDNGLKRLWTRRKSKGNDGRKDSGGSSLRDSQSTGKTYQSTTTSSPRSNHTRNTSTDNGKPRLSPATGHRFQPSLASGFLSRPAADLSRPTTDGSGSLQNAVTRAADSVAKAEQEYKSSADRYAREHIRPKTPRYVDIFSLSSSNSPNPKPGYNEDVAERNLDLTKVALEGTHDHYIPSSKYQEEVAARNATPALPGSPATSQGLSYGAQSPSQIESASHAISSRSRSPAAFDDRSFSRLTQNLHNSLASHSQQRTHHFVESLQLFHELPAHGDNGEGFPRPRTSNGIGMQPPTAVHNLQRNTSMGALRNAGRVTLYDPAAALEGYQLSKMERTQLKSAESSSHAQRYESSIHSAPSPSSVKRTINLPNRTIMDLTGDDPDVFAEPSHSSNRSSSPPLDHPRTKTLRSISESVSEPFTDHKQPQSDSNLSDMALPTIPEVKPAAWVSQPKEPPPHSVSTSPKSKNILSSAAFSSNFTPIITIASASPRTSLVMEKTATYSGIDEAQGGNPQPDSRHGEVKLPSYPSENNRDNPREKKSPETQKEKVTGSATMGNTMKQTPYSTLEHRPEPPTRPYIHLSSENQNPIGHASGASGVNARDFGNSTPKSPLTSVPEVTEPHAIVSTIPEYAELHADMPTVSEATELHDSMASNPEDVTPRTSVASIPEDTKPHNHTTTVPEDIKAHTDTIITPTYTEPRTNLTNFPENVNPRPDVTSVPGNMKPQTDMTSVREDKGRHTKMPSITEGTELLNGGNTLPEDLEPRANGYTATQMEPPTEVRPRRNFSPNGPLFVSPHYQSTFDEAEFAQKQAEARDALVRLQLSLNENFLSHPNQIPIVRSTKNSPSRHQYSFSDGKPAAPSSIFAQFRETSPVPADTRAEPNNPRPETSYHRQTTVRPQNSPPPALRESRANSMRNKDEIREKRNRRVQLELDGPGPSIVNDEQKQYAPYPPPLHLGSQAAYQRLSQQQTYIPPSPASPGEISLSSFPIPGSSPRQTTQSPPPLASPTERQHGSRPPSENASHTSFPTNIPGMKERILKRQSSLRSQASSASVFSIPVHMIPDRSSSIRDRSVMEDDE